MLDGEDMEKKEHPSFGKGDTFFQKNVVYIRASTCFCEVSIVVCTHLIHDPVDEAELLLPLQF